MNESEKRRITRRVVVLSMGQLFLSPGKGMNVNECGFTGGRYLVEKEEDGGFKREIEIDTETAWRSRKDRNWDPALADAPDGAQQLKRRFTRGRSAKGKGEGLGNVRHRRGPGPVRAEGLWYILVNLGIFSLLGLAHQPQPRIRIPQCLVLFPGYPFSLGSSR